MGLHRDARACLRYQPEVIVDQDGQRFVVDAETAIALLPDTDGSVLSAMRVYQDRQGRELCHIPCVDRRAHEVMAREIDASEYGRSAVTTRAQLIAMRTVRAERAATQGEKVRRMRERDR